MNVQLRRLGAGLLACYVALFAMVSWIQVVRADDLNEATFRCRPIGAPRSAPVSEFCANNRAIIRDFDKERGQIIAADGTVLAETVPASGESQFEFQRQYPTGDLFGHITGYFNFNFGATGVERSYNDELAGETAEQELRSLSDLFVDRSNVGDLHLTLRADVQQIAREALGDQQGSVVAIDPRDGSILAMWSFPAHDPNPLSSHDLAASQAAKDQLEAAPGKPLRARTYQERFPPGSTFKVVVASTGVNRGDVTPQEPSYPVTGAFDIDFTRDDLNNFGGSSCGGTLFSILARSCNTAFAAMGVDTIGEAGMSEGAEAFGFNDRPPLDLPAAVESAFPTDFPDDEGNGPLARQSIGQGGVQATPLEMAMIAGTVANNGVMMTPHVMAEVRDEDGDIVTEYEPEPWRQAISADAAGVMREAMIGVVEGGTATRLAIDGVVVGGKTGTATLEPEPGSHAWIIGFGGAEDGPASVAVAVIVESQEGASEATGGRVAAPIARAVMERILQIQGVVPAGDG
ncbi:MAG: peptidoglycan D,D-transpeptidase FtsI family protein [Acidimicrobiales bacterium]